ncbi:hypothetical protein [Solimonas marina]|uniref:Uncharacterized protein n=1 Tax=Solimonas marina TaxID=2714601 RepID=A0A969WBD1_9GAMM|nr:hypothetical protein [Solimonas marina]NKF23399.1 hypothetical protein [Solimonas marina]
MSDKTWKQSVESYEELRLGLEYAVHELPAGILGGPNSATPEECAELMDDLNKFEALCKVVEIDSAVFIEQCRWHFEHYPHYLSRHRHFKGYASYVIPRKGPLKVTAKPAYVSFYPKSRSSGTP